MRNRFYIVTLGLLLGLVIMGCSANQTVQPTNSATADGYPIHITHAHGTTTIYQAPERIVTLSWSNQDIPLALGVVPVGFSEANYGVADGSRLLPWTAQRLQELGGPPPMIFRDAAGFDFEAISDAQPDVILAAYSGMTKEEYDLLSQIAPVVAYPRDPWNTFWREQIQLNSKAMGMEVQGLNLIAELETKIVQQVSLFPELDGKTAGFFYFIPSDFSQYYVYLPEDPRAAFLSDLGFIHPQSIITFAEQFGGFATLLSSEQVDKLSDIDVIVAYGNQELLTNLQGDSLLGTIPAIQRGSVVFLEDNSPLAAAVNPSALSLPAILEEYVSSLAMAARRISD
jgi:iron complex transport system substrate-binding protein